MTYSAKAFKPSITTRIKGLDELRGIAIILVLINHSQGLLNIHITGFGPLGVDIFFIISGYLIGHILYKSQTKDGFLREFYVRRIFRILPLSILMVCLGVIASNILGRTYLNIILHYLTFTQNFISPTIGIPESDPLFVAPILGCSPMWSLAIEEQFYITLALLMYFVKAKYIAPMVFLSAISALTARMLFMDGDFPFYYTNAHETWFRAHYLGVGVLMALPRAKQYLYVFFFYWLILYVADNPGNGILELPFTALITFMVYQCIFVGSIIRNELLAHLGRLCFGLYVLHWPVARAFEKIIHISDVYQGLALSILYLCLSYAAARVSYKYFEIPIQNYRTRFEGAGGG